ncbi:MAG: lyase family protein [Microthrixaceae bacterium]
MRSQLGLIAQRVLELVDVLATRADEAGTGDDAVYLPGYTHLQHAQPVLLAHHLMAHAWALLRDVDRLSDCRQRVDVSPLGSGRAGRVVPPARSRRSGSGARVRSPFRELPRRDIGP